VLTGIHVLKHQLLVAFDQAWFARIRKIR